MENITKTFETSITRSFNSLAKQDFLNAMEIKNKIENRNSLEYIDYLLEVIKARYYVCSRLKKNHSSMENIFIKYYLITLANLAVKTRDAKLFETILYAL